MDEKDVSMEEMKFDANMSSKIAGMFEEIDDKTRIEAVICTAFTYWAAKNGIEAEEAVESYLDMAKAARSFYDAAM